MLILNAVLLQTVSQRLENEKRSTGIAAMEAAQSILGDYVVSLEPGFVLETAVDDNLLLWLSRVVGHELNLYWGSRLSASSKPELFAAGFLPERIPGEVYAELSTGQLPLASRPRRAGGADYLEFYAPLRLPGVDRLGANLFLSMPLLAQEEEVAEEIAALRRKALLASTGLFLLLLAVGGQLARNFTAPIMALVRGTERIAAGEGRLGIEPRDTELLTLSRAIDDMADRIGRARSQLQREKEVVESMVENITAGVVSLDPEGNIVTANRVAKALLGVEIGGTLEAAAGSTPRLAALMEFVREDATRLRRATLRLPAPESPAESDEDPTSTDWSAVWVPLAAGGELGALLVVEDVTEVLQGQRLQAWAEMARMIAHEIKNPLTPIRLSTEHLREVYSSEPERIGEIFERCTSNILTQVDELRLISSEFATYSRIPKIDPVDGDLVAVSQDIVSGYAASRFERDSRRARHAAGDAPGSIRSKADAPSVAQSGRERGSSVLRRPGRFGGGSSRGGPSDGRRSRSGAGCRCRGSRSHLRALLLDPRDGYRTRIADHAADRRGARRYDHSPQRKRWRARCSDQSAAHGCYRSGSHFRGRRAGTRKVEADVRLDSAGERLALGRSDAPPLCRGRSLVDHPAAGGFSSALR